MKLPSKLGKLNCWTKIEPVPAIIAEMVDEPRKEGEIFRGWSLSEDLNGQVYHIYMMTCLNTLVIMPTSIQYLCPSL